MNGSLILTLFFALLGIVLAWFVLVKLLFTRLERAHPEKYESMGKPSLFWRNSPAGAFAMLKFLVAREHRSLNDSYLSKLSDAMLVFLLIYMVLFFGLIFMAVGQGPVRVTV